MKIATKAECGTGIYLRESMNLHACLIDKRRYWRQIERLQKRYLFTPYLYELQQDGVSLATLSLNRSAIAKRIAKTVARGEYQLGPAQIRKIKVGAKERTVFAYRLTDRIVQGVVEEVIQEAMVPILSKSLYSYRKGISWWNPVSQFAAYIRDHRKSRPEPKTRGLYVLRHDIKSYTDSIPVGETSPLWKILQSVFSLTGSADSLSPADCKLIKAVIRPQAFVEEGVILTQCRGVPTGQPISCVLFNLYLTNFDKELDEIPGSFYARYCDDLLFAHPEAAVVGAIDSKIRKLLSEVWLELNEKKSQILYLTGAGSQSPDWEESRGTTSVPFLGCRISAHGTVSLNGQKCRDLLSDLEERAVRTARALKTRDQDTVGPTVCRVINQALEAKIEFSQQRSACLLRKAVTDRHQLRQLDYWIARIVLWAVTGQKGPRAFRTVPYKTIREDWNLISLLHARNKWPRKSWR